MSHKSNSEIVPELESTTKSKQDEKKPQAKQAGNTVPLSALRRYFTGCDSALFYLGGVAAFVAGAAMPSMALLFGDLTDTFNPANTEADPLDEIARIAIIFLVIGLGAWLLSYIFFAFFLTIAAKTAAQFKVHYLSSILK